MLVGYARVSTTDQNLDLQKDALQSAGCEKIFTDVANGAKSAREGLDAALAFMRPGDALVVWKLDRLGRSLKHLIDVVTDLEQREVGFRSLQESIDTTTSGGKLIFHVFGALVSLARALGVTTDCTLRHGRIRKQSRARRPDDRLANGPRRQMCAAVGATAKGSTQ